jgi:hypothetical protein
MANPFIDLIEAAGPLLLSSMAVFASMGAVLDLLRWFRSREKDIGARIEIPSGSTVIHNRRTTHDSKWPGDRKSESEAATIERQEAETIENATQYVTVRPRRTKGPFLALVLVAIVFAISLAVLWSLMHMGGPIEATVNATIQKAGGSILIVGGGLVGAFFAISIIALIAIHVFTNKFDE